MSERAPLTLEDVRHIAQLARLELTAAEETQYLGELNQVLGIAEALDQVDADLPETHNVTGLTNVWREDVATATLLPDEVFHNAPRQDGEHFSLPKTL